MFPLVAIATSILPDLIKLIAGDKAGTVATDVANAVKAATGTSDPAAAKQKIATDPAAASNLQIQLAQIALTAAKAQNDEDNQQRQDELADLKQRLADVTDARANLLNLAKSQSPVVWVAPTVSFVVMLGFYAILLFLVIHYYTDGKAVDNQLINICIGAMVAAFSTVVNFWLGSSKGSQDKDIANLQLQTTHAAQTSDIIKTQAAQTTAALNAATTAAAASQPPASSAAPTPTTDTTDNFNQCFAVILVQEGGYTNDPNDRGGPTNLGITMAELQAWRGDGHTVTVDDVKNLTKNEAQEIYRTNYWNPMRCADLPKGIDLVVFDFGVNAGTRTSIKALQTVVGVTSDGSIGPVTISAVTATDPHTVVQNFSARRLDCYRSLTGPTGWPTFGTGWTNRTNSVEQTALKMIGQAG